MNFWQEWLRHQLRQFSVKHGGFKAPSHWLKRNHPLLKTMRSDTKVVNGSDANESSCRYWTPAWPC
jgi:hypothetical protein